MKITTYSTCWGADDVSVRANWSNAACPVDGDAHGRQVADFCHDWRAALRSALAECAKVDGLSEANAEPMIAKAMAKAKQVTAE